MASKAGLGLLFGVAAVGAGLYFMSTASAAPKPPAPTPNPLNDELARLYQQNPSLYASVTQALATATAPDDLRRLQQAVQFSYPNLGSALDARFKATTISLQSGVDLHLPGTSGGVQFPVVSLDPLGNLHFYTQDLTPIAVVKAGPTPSSNISVTRNPSSAFDDIVRAIMATDLNPFVARLTQKPQPSV